MTDADRKSGALLDLEVGPPAHGGWCVARHEGRVIFVRHALPGERVRAAVTSETTRFARADAVEIVTPSPHRVAPPCPVARPGGCGGCDWQHADPAYQRRLKAAVVAEQLWRLARVEVDVEVEEVAGGALGWRTRVRFAVDDEGRAGFRKHRSHDVVAVDGCPIAHPLVEEAGVERLRWPAGSIVDVVASATTGDLVVRPQNGRAPDPPANRRNHSRRPDAVREVVSGRTFRVGAGGFWQVHPQAARTLTRAVIEALAPRPGERVLDLYAGAGLFAAAVAPLIAPGGQVLAVEGDPAAAADARANLADLPQARVRCAPVADVLRGWNARRRVDLVVLDPPRAGAGPALIEDLVRLCPRAIAYVACDPASLARDLAAAAAQGYRLSALRAFDLFPMTHHVECVALVDAPG